MTSKIAILTIILFMAMPGACAYAAESVGELGEINVVYDDGETTGDTVSDDTQPSPASESDEPDFPDGDEAEIINALDTAYAEDSSCEIDAKAAVPEYFGLNIYINIKNLDNGKIYQIPLYKENAYRQRCYVPEGSYTVMEVSVFEDSTGAYPFTCPDDFHMDADETHSLEITLGNYEEIESEINEKRASVAGSAMDDSTDVRSDAGTVIDRDELIPSPETDFEVEYNGEGRARLGIKGSQTGEFDIRVRIEKGGFPGDMRVSISTDKGNTWLEDQPVALDSFMQLKGTGLTLEFAADPSDKTGFIEGDLYSCYVQDPGTELVVTQGRNCSAFLSLCCADPNNHPFNVLEDNGISLAIRVEKDGTFGTAVVSLSLDGGKTYGEQTLVPDDGILRLAGYDLICDFRTMKDGRIAESQTGFRKGGIYTAVAKRRSIKNLIFFLAASSAVLCVLAVTGYMKMMSLMPKKSQYRINTYIPYRKRRGI